MSKLRELTKRDRVAEAIGKMEIGEQVDWNLLASLQPMDAVVAGRAALNDALDHHEESDELIKGICGG